VYRKFGLVNSTVQWICKNRIKVISAFERNVLTIKRLRNPVRSGVNEALLYWCERERSDNVPASGPLFVVTFRHGYVLHEGTAYHGRVPYISQMTSRLLLHTAAAMRAHNVLCKLFTSHGRCYARA
jgi:hypothetical protein